jgi:class 3 adenylate cyclase
VTKPGDDSRAAEATPPGEPAASPDAAHPRRRRKLSAIMMADVSGFSRMMGADEEHTVGLIQDFHRRVQSLVEHFEGRVVDTAGDSVFGEFDSVINAVRCARRIQEEQAAANAAQRPEERIETRIGVHLGDVIVEDYRVYGDGVNIAARLEPIADPGGICISEAVYQQIRDKLDLPVQEIGVRELKNIQHPIRLYKVPPPEAAAAISPPTHAAETHARPPAAMAAAPAHAAVPRTPPMAEGRKPSWGTELRHPATLILAVTAVFLLLSPVLLFSTAGALPTAGAVLLGISLGRVWAIISGRSGNFLIALGLGVACGAVFTDWSRITNSLFVLAGLILVAVGLGGRRHARD